MNVLLVLPVLIPSATAAVLMLLRRRPALQRALSITGAGALLAAGIVLFLQVRDSGIQATQMGGWPAPFGITMAADLFGAVMVVMAGLVGTAVAVYSAATIDRRRELFGYHPLLQILLMGVCGAFLTGDLFDLYVWFEVMLIASFVLMALGGERAQLEGAIKYVVLNLLSSALFLAAVGILYGTVGTLNMADLSLKLAGAGDPGLSVALGMLFLAAFGIKAALFPLFFWLPASYHTPPPAVSALFAGLLTKVGVYSLIRVFTLLFVNDVQFTHSLILVVSGLTMVTGVLGAAAQTGLRRLLSFHIISQIGYMTMGLGLFTVFGLAGSIFYIVHNIVAKTNLFLVAGVVEHSRGTGDLKRLGGLYRDCPGLSILFLIPALSLAGVPPLSGFFGKLILVQAGLEIGGYLIVGTALAVGLLTMFSMTKIWAEAFWKPEPAAEDSATATALPLRSDWAWAPIVAFAALTVCMGVAAEWFFDVATAAARQLMNPDEYVRAVLRERTP